MKGGSRGAFPIRSPAWTINCQRARGRGAARQGRRASFPRPPPFRGGLRVFQRPLRAAFPGLRVLRRPLRVPFPALRVSRRPLRVAFPALRVLRRPLRAAFPALRVLRRPLRAAFPALHVSRRTVNGSFPARRAVQREGNLPRIASTFIHIQRNDTPYLINSSRSPQND